MNFLATEIIDRIKTKTSLKNLESIGISSAVISAWKTRNSIPRSDDLYKIATYIGVSMEWLLTGKGSVLEDTEALYKKKYETLLESISAVIKANSQ